MVVTVLNEPKQGGIKQRLKGLFGGADDEQMSSSYNDLASDISETSEQPQTCRKCGIRRAIKSRANSGDRLIVRLLPWRPYRCLNCYHRYWWFESFFSDRTRVRTWVLLLCALMLYLVLKVVLALLASPTTDPATFAKAPAASVTMVATPSESTIGGKIVRTPATQPASDQAAIAAVAATGESDATEEQTQNTDTNSSPAANAEQVESSRAGSATSPLDDAEAEAEELRFSKSRVAETLEKWRMAWESGDAEYYLTFYAPFFNPDIGTSRETWRKQRLERVTPQKQIRLQLEDVNLEVARNNDVGFATFTQHYSSRNFQEQMRKQLRFVKVGSKWLIVSERAAPKE
ncbi:L,D-transpeptidase Cds6 family protein [Halioxenophilus aromaticivorans]|uniref:Cds6 C-terminal domain-containing protein n=1 Tax=Halioxenophilus aromaticivorans TaxID=1306992 RepID=A0AAV3U4M8_9ALTE